MLLVVEFNCCDDRDYLFVMIEITQGKLVSTHCIVLGSDGLFEKQSNQQLMNLILAQYKSTADLSVVCTKIVQDSILKLNCRDNVSLLIFQNR
jgi:serine/threonine protein phosphatase PrpC